MATESSVLVWKIPGLEEPGQLQLMGCKESDTTERLASFSLSLSGEFPDGPVVRTLHSHCQGPRFNP